MSELKVFPGKNETNEMKDMIRNFISNMSEYIEYMKLTAKLSKIKYDALIKEGFSKEQAVELCKKLF